MKMDVIPETKITSRVYKFISSHVGKKTKQGDFAHCDGKEDERWLCVCANLATLVKLK